MSYDTPLALVIIVAALLWWAASAVGKYRQKRRLVRMGRNTPPVVAARDETDTATVDREFARLTEPLEEHPFNQEVE